MISLNVEEYCHNCPDFGVYVKSDVYSFYTMQSYSNMECSHIITCKHEDRCRQIKRYLEKEKKE